MKTFLSIFTVMVVLFSFTGCSNRTPEQNLSVNEVFSEEGQNIQKSLTDKVNNLADSCVDISKTVARSITDNSQ